MGSDRDLLRLTELHGNMACSLPGNLGHPQSYAALYKSLKYSTRTVVVTVQKHASTLCLCLPFRTSFPARSRVWELCLLLLPGDRSGAQQPGQGKAGHTGRLKHSRHPKHVQRAQATIPPKTASCLPQHMSFPGGTEGPVRRRRYKHTRNFSRR